MNPHGGDGGELVQSDWLLWPTFISRLSSEANGSYCDHLKNEEVFNSATTQVLVVVVGAGVCGPE